MLCWINIDSTAAYVLAAYLCVLLMRVLLYKSLHGMAPKYLTELCRPISDVQGRRHLRSAARGLLLTPRYYLSTLFLCWSICLEFSSGTFAGS